MKFSQRQADPRRHLAGFTFVILSHVLIVYALVARLAKKVVDAVRAPTEITALDDAVRRAVCAGIGSTSAPLTSMCS